MVNFVNFNVTEDPGFKGSLIDLGVSAHIDVLQALVQVQANNLTWDHFTTRHGWVHRVLVGEDTYPGANLLYDFVVVGPSGQTYRVTGSNPNGAIVVCAVAVEL